MFLKDWLRIWWPPKPKPVPTTTTTLAPLSPPTSIEIQLLVAHNGARTNNNRPVVFRWSGQLGEAARGHCRQMAAKEDMAHEGIGDGTPWQRIQATGYRYSMAAENIAGGYQSVEAVMAGWMNSPGHRANILGATREIGCSVAVSARGVWYWCVVFGTPAVGLGVQDLGMVKIVREHSRSGVGEASSIRIVTDFTE